jgi:hypothetical protein
MSEVNEAIDKASARRRECMKICRERFEELATEELKGMSEESKLCVVCLMAAAQLAVFDLNQTKPKETK